MSKTKEQGIKDRTGQVVATVEAFQKLGCRFTCVSIQLFLFGGTLTTSQACGVHKYIVRHVVCINI